MEDAAGRWEEALAAGMARRVLLMATQERTLEVCALAGLKRPALDLS